MLTWEEAVSLYNPINIVEAYQEEEGVTKASQQHHNNRTTSSFLPFLKASSSFLAMLRSCHYLLVFFWFGVLTIPQTILSEGAGARVRCLLDRITKLHL